VPKDRPASGMAHHTTILEAHTILFDTILIKSQNTGICRSEGAFDPCPTFVVHQPDYVLAGAGKNTQFIYQFYFGLIYCVPHA
jgi:hypothetical protein